jgi:hypothetical protein
VVAKLHAAELEVWPGDHSLKRVDPVLVNQRVLRWLGDL